jgi:phytoene/squalene synthetase
MSYKSIHDVEQRCYILPESMDTPDKSSLDFAERMSFKEILTNPFLDIGARFWADDRYRAFQVCYRSMRKIDDLVDERKAEGGPIGAEEAIQYIDKIDDWLSAVRARNHEHPFLAEFTSMLDRFVIPLWPWERLGRAMAYDLKHDGFATFTSFLRYTEGAAVAPASVYMHLCGLRETASGFQPPRFDIRRAARPLAVFSYLVHIIRDFQEDQLRGLDYFADNLLTEYGLSRGDLRRIAEGGPVTDSFRNLIRRYVDFAAYYRALARRTVDSVLPLMDPRYQLSVEVIYGLYSLVFEKIDPGHGEFTEESLNPAPEQVEARLERIIRDFKPTPTA